jgi:predicted double-glycine peptidase
MKHLITEFKKYKNDTILLEEFPNIRQDFGYDCGPTCMQMILVYYGIELRLDKLILKIPNSKEIKKCGTPPEDVVKTFKLFNIKAEIKENQTEDDIKKYLDKGKPVMLVLQAYSDKENPNYKKDWKDGHYVVSIGYNNEHFIFADPSSFEKTYLTYEELKGRWHDVSKNEEKYINTMIVIHGGNEKFDPKKIKHME